MVLFLYTPEKALGLVPEKGEQMIDALTKNVEFDTLFGRLLAVANCSSSEELASRLDVGCSLFDECRETCSVPLSLLVIASYKLDVSLRCLYDTDCGELITTTKRLTVLGEQIKQRELEAAHLQKEITRKDAELTNISRIREAFILELTAAKDKLSVILESVSPESSK
jgi:hypothetical protein